MSDLTKIELSVSEVRKAEAKIKSFLETLPPVWNNLKDNIQKIQMNNYLNHLWGTNNSDIVNKLTLHSEILHNFLKI